MLDSKYCKIEDFLLDDSFVEWVLGNSMEQDSYWENFLSKRPECEENLKQASNVILSFRIKPVKDLSQKQIDQIIATVKSRYQQEAVEETLFIQKRKFVIGYNLLRYAAIVTVCISLGWLGYNAYTNKKDTHAQTAFVQTYHQVVNSGTTPMLIKLPDHSSVILKPNAQLRYPNIFNGAKREVNLTGEAFFEVTKNPRKPFFVYSNELTVRVVGTSFLVKAIKGDNQYKIIVSTGKVEVLAHRKNNPANIRHSILLTPNEQAVVYRADLRLEMAVLKKPLLLSKESTKIHFNFIGTPFSKVISTIQEAYGVSIIYNEKIMGNCQLTASLIDQPLDERLRLICKAVEAEYKIVDGHIVIDGKGCN